jgi:hypothetical protein
LSAGVPINTTPEGATMGESPGWMIGVAIRSLRAWGMGREEVMRSD